MKKKVYAVRKGRKTGIFYSWKECEMYVKGYSGAQYRSFPSKKEAQQYLSSTLIQNKKYQVSPSSQNIKEQPTKLHSSGVSQEARVEVYIDGSYNMQRKIAGYGLVMIVQNQVYLKDFSAYPYSDVTATHNVGAELMGARRAVELALANGWKHMILYYDYTGIENFATQAWRAKNPQTQEYQDFMQKYMRNIEIQFVKVKAHSGNEYNDLADRLAKYATNL
ncbi:ribonuclease H (plasmid) [Bacillus cereus]|uniref:ribonuclease H1 domain-containing protein n=1 Tax=Bacillus cereus TaxID=1396 RepID=UPI000C2CE348|nr:ribonuclease H family protein [Bacillus cereus]AUB67288.1 ribonuclease H [Bacillus cereus]